MSVAMLLRIFSDCCIYFAIMGSGPISFDVPLLLPALLCGVSAAVAVFLEKKGLSVLRKISCILPFSCLLLAPDLWQGLIFAVPAIYTGFVILRGKLQLEYYHYRRFFLRSLVLLGGAYILTHIWMFLTQITGETVLPLDPEAILRYGIVHAVCGVILQRQLRLGVGSRAEGGKRQMVMLLSTAVVLVLGFLAAETLLRQGVSTVLEYVLSLLLMPMVLLYELVLAVMALLESIGNTDKDYEAFLEHLNNINKETQELVQGNADRPEAIPVNLTVVWLVLVGIFLVIAAVLLFHSFYRRRADTDVEEVVNRVVMEPKKKKAATFSNRARVRQLYRDFLRAEKNLGLKLNVSDTSADILDRIHPNTHRPSADELREVYLQARYDERQTISRSQVESARQALKGTRKGQS